MPPKRESEKPKVIEYLYQRWQAGELPDGIVTSDRVAEAIRNTEAQLGIANPANFLKDIVRTDNANSIWPASLTAARISARQLYGEKRVFQFIGFIKGQTEPFPDRFLPDSHTREYEIQSASLPFAARQMGRPEETWLTQVLVNLRIIETQLSIFSPLRDRVRDVTHLQMGMKTQPEIDAVYLASYGASADLKSPTSLHLLITCEAKQARQRILEDQIREQVAKAFEVTAKLKVPEINAVKPMATKVVETSDRSRAIFVVEFSHIDRTKFEAKWERTSELDDRLFSMTLKVASKTIYRITPSVAGLNAP